jgi:small subunit ribosomal protein S4e
LNLSTNEVDGLIKLENGSSVFCTGGNNIGRVGVLQHIEHHPGSYEIAHVKDSTGNTFATRLTNIFAIGAGKDTQISLPRGKGIRLSLIQERDQRVKHVVAAADEE